MSDLRELYQEVILDHGKNPRNHREIGGETTCRADGHNPVCGDRLTVYVQVEDGVVRDVAFRGSGCAISTASASMMTQTLKGRPLDEARRIFEGFHALVTGQPGEPASDLGKLAVFAGVRDFPVRVKCATLAWHTCQAALERREEPVSTE